MSKKEPTKTQARLSDKCAECGSEKLFTIMILEKPYAATVA